MMRDEDEIYDRVHEYDRWKSRYFVDNLIAAVDDQRG